MLKAIYSYFGQANSMSEEAFCDKFAPFWLLVEPFEMAKEQLSVATVSGGKVVPTERSLAQIKKRDGANAFANMLTIGRMPNNDLTLPAPDVSSFHGYFSPRADGQGLVLTDAASSYGTTLNGARLAAQTATPVKVGDSITFASVHSTLMSAAQVYSLLRGGR